MLVETFEQKVEHHPEACEEASRLIEELGLVGQQTLTNPEQAETRCPYRQWHADEMEVYSLLCPSTDKAEDYDADTIPLRVLQVLAHAKSLEIYETFRVLHAANPAVKDPVLVGVPTGQQWSRSKWHILARWGAELDEFPVLADKAARLKAAKMLDEVLKVRAEVEVIVARVEAAITNGHSLLGKQAPSFFANGW